MPRVIEKLRDCGHGICGPGTIVTNVSVMSGPPASPERPSASAEALRCRAGLAMAGRPGRIPAQMIAHILYYFSEQGDLVLDPMAGGGVVADTCLALNRRCRSFDMDDRPDTRPEIERYFWDINNL